MTPSTSFARRQIDHFLWLLARIAMAVWFKDVQVVARERVPDSGPVLIVASHFNGILDPALVAATTPRVPRFLGAASFWRNPVLGRLLDFVGALPVRRQKEGRTEANAPVFEACHEALLRGEVVALFPEGVTHDEPRLAPLRTGAARIAFGAHEAGVRDLVIVPIGLVYAAKTRPRSRALVRVGEPIHLDQALGRYVDPGAKPVPENSTAVRRLTEDVQGRLGDAALDYDNADLALVAGAAAEVALRPSGATPDWAPPLDDLERCARAIIAAPPDAQLEVIKAFVVYHDTLALLNLRDADLVTGQLTSGAVRLQVGQLTAVASLLPAAAVGGAVNGPAVGLIWAAGRLQSTVAMRGTVRLLTGLVALPATWGLLRWSLGRRRVPHPTLATALSGPGCGLVALGLAERLRALRSARESVQRVREHAAILPALLDERAALVEAVVSAVEAGDPAPSSTGLHRTRSDEEG